MAYTVIFFGHQLLSRRVFYCSKFSNQPRVLTRDVPAYGSSSGRWIGAELSLERSPIRSKFTCRRWGGCYSAEVKVFGVSR